MSTDDLLASTCECGRRVRVLWSGPLSTTSRPVLLVCGWHPKPRCGFSQPIPQDKVTRIGDV